MRNADCGLRIEKSEIRNPKSEIRNPKSEMPAKGRDLAEAVKDAVAGGSFALAIDAATRAYKPEYSRSELTGKIKVTVAWAGVLQSPATRNKTFDDIEIQIAVQTAVALQGAAADVDQVDTTEVDGLVDLVQEIITLLRFTRQSDCSWLKSQNEPIYNPDRLSQGIFESIITITYRHVK